MLLLGCACGEAVNHPCMQHRSQRLDLWHSSRRQQSLRRSIPTKGQLDQERDRVGRNLQTKLARRRAGAAHLCLGYADRRSGSAQPDSPSQSSELPCDRWAVCTRNQSTRLSQKERQLIGLLATVPESHLQHPRSIQQLLGPHGAVQGTASPVDDAW